MPTKKTILIDFDGVLSKYEGWKGEGELGPPLDKARAACYALAKDYKLVCFTTRNRHWVEPWLTQHGFPIQAITSIKIPAFLQIDDRSLCFTGSWDDEFLRRVREFKPWWEV